MSNISIPQTDPLYLQKQLEIARKEIHNLRQQIISLNHVHKKECEHIYKKLQNWQCMECQTRQNCHENCKRNPNVKEMDFKYNYIGSVSTNFPEKRGTPRQPGICSDLIAKLTLNNNVFTNPSHALEGLQEFSHMWILFHFHKNDSTHVRAKVSPPRLNGIRTGVFATRSPHRPCPIGLSLVKINRIVENVIYFSGVDMIDKTPVLDIKPFIPQYDNPGLSNLYYPEESLFEDENEVLTESAIDVVNSRENIDLRDVPSTSSIDNVTNALDTLNIRVMDGEENGRSDHIVGATTPDNTHTAAEESFHVRSSSRIGEREAPDGEEEESPRNPQTTSISIPNTPEGQIRVPAWIDQAPVSRLSVLFKDRALQQLSQLGPEGEEKKITITNVLREDPRSIYLRERWGSHCYVFRIADLCVSCKFNDTNHSVTVYQVFQNDAPEGDE